ncbi:MAG: DUF6288 domain-containing protein [Kiritimatiellia bacterium]
MNTTTVRVLLVVVLCGLGMQTSALAQRVRPTYHKTPPDLTQGGAPDDTHDWSLGPLGANGWCFSLPTNRGASDLARQILVTWIDPSGPAAGNLILGDVILGVDGGLFAQDARKALAAAINEAEKAENQGALNLLVWREGVTAGVTLTLPVMGTYSATAPFHCEKTARIIDNAIAFMKTRTYKPSWLTYIDGLGMLATGRNDLMPIVRQIAHDSVIPGEVLSIEKHVAMKCWDWSYKTLFLCEYYLATGDDYVLPTITEYATKIAMGQSGAGTWGHTYAAIENAGHMHGPLGGYGAINQMGLTMMIVLPLAQKCGVDNDEIRQAIVRGNTFFGHFIGRGTIPYGDHGPANEWFDDNGKSGAAAIFFDLMGNREGAAFFSDMVLASSVSGREAGHTGHFWSHLWGGIGAARGGDVALQTFMDQMNWTFTLERQPDGRMVYQGNAGEAEGGKGQPKTKWDSTGARLLQLCAPRRAIYITGFDPTGLAPVVKEVGVGGDRVHATFASTDTRSAGRMERLKQILRAGRLDIDRASRDQLELPQILELLKDPLPPTRAIGARILAERNINAVDALVVMLDSDDRYARYGAAEALCKAGFASQAAADKLIAMLQTSDDITFKTYAIKALINRDKQRGLLSVAKPAIPVLLKMAVEPLPDDPRGVLQQTVSHALFYRGNAQPSRGLLVEYGLDGDYRTLLVPAIRDILTNQNGGARSNLAWVYNALQADELDLLWGDIVNATRHIAPSGIMFASGIRDEGLRLMVKRRIKEGVELTAYYIRHQNAHGSGKRMPEVLDILLQYGGHAKAVIPELERHASYFASRRAPGRAIRPDDLANQIRAAIEKIQAMEEPAADDKLVSIAEMLK